MYHIPLRTFAETERTHPDETQQIREAPLAWSANIKQPDSTTLSRLPTGTDITLQGPVGEATLGVVVSPEGHPLYDKLVYTHRPSVLIVAWGRDQQERIRIVYLTQERPFAVDEEVREHQRLRFGQIPMGFLNDEERRLPLRESIIRAAKRELFEETGITRILNIEVPFPATCWPDPTMVTNGGYLAFVEVDFSGAYEPPPSDDHERILGIEYLLVRELRERIAKGYHTDERNKGVNYHMGLSLGPLLVFFAHHPELFVTS